MTDCTIVKQSLFLFIISYLELMLRKFNNLRLYELSYQPCMNKSVKDILIIGPPFRNQCHIVKNWLLGGR